MAEPCGNRDAVALNPEVRGKTDTAKVLMGSSASECLNGEIFYSLKEAQVVIEHWRVEYNTRRPHSALGYRPPAPAAYSPLVSPGSVSRPEAVM